MKALILICLVLILVAAGISFLNWLISNNDFVNSDSNELFDNEMTSSNAPDEIMNDYYNKD